MKFITSDECVRWCAHNNFSTEGRCPAMPPVPHSRINFRIPTDAGRRVALCRLLWSLADDASGRERLVWITEWSIWPSGEHLPLWTRFRQAFGDDRALEESPGCLCGEGDGDDGLSVLVTGCLFLWDCWVFSQSGAAVFLSHDEVGDFFAQLGIAVPSSGRPQSFLSPTDAGY